MIDGGTIKNHKGVNIPGANLGIDVITEKDEKDLKMALLNDVDFVAISFVRSGKDILDLSDKFQQNFLH